MTEDIEQAFKILEEYWQDPAAGDTRVYQKALALLQREGSVQRGLGQLFEDVTRPGGLTSAQAEALMPVYWDVVERLAMPTVLRQQFLLHLAGCEECATQYAALNSFEANLAEPSEVGKLPRFSVPPLPTQTPTKKTVATQTPDPVAGVIAVPAQTPSPQSSVGVAWPERWNSTRRVIAEAGKSFKTLIGFQPQPASNAGMLGTPPDQTHEELGLETGVGLEKAKEIALFNHVVRQVGIAGRAIQSDRPDNCTIVVSLKSIQLTNRLADHRVTLSYPNHQETALTNKGGQVFFENIPIAQLLALRLEVTINL